MACVVGRKLLINRGLMVSSIYAKLRDNCKGDIMYNYKIDNETTDKVISSYNSSKDRKLVDELIDRIHTIDSNYKNIDIPEYDQPDFKRLDDIKINSEDIKNQATQSLTSYKNDAIGKIESDYQKNKQKLDNSKIDLEKGANEDKLALKSYFDDAKENAKNNAIMRGVARSSIIVNTLDAFDKNEIDNINKIDSELSEGINAINFQLSSLNQQKEKALNDFDISYAVKLNDKINSLTAELNTKQEEVTKYNNQIEEKELKYKQSYDQFVADLKNDNADNNAKLVELAAKYGSKVVANYRKNQIFDALDAYFDGMDRASVIEMLNTNDQLKSVLGGLYDEVIERYKK